MSKETTTEAYEFETNETSHYLRGQKTWAVIFGSFIEQRNRWRTVATGCLVVLVMSLTLNILQANQAKVVPYVVEVDKLGQMRGVRKAERMDKLPVAIIQGALKTFVTSWRTVTADIGLQEKFLRQTSYVAVGSAKGTLKEWFGEHNPYQRGQKVLVEVRVQGVPLLISGRSWQVEWREITRNRSGATEKEEMFEASIQVQIQPPQSESEILNNPSGLFVTSISCTQKFK